MKMLATMKIATTNMAVTATLKHNHQLVKSLCKTVTGLIVDPLEL
jgi:hypothetical protein